MNPASIMALADPGTNVMTLARGFTGPQESRGVDALDLLRLVGYGLLMLWALWWLGTRLGRWPSLQRLVRAQGSLRVLESRPLGFRCQLHLIAYGEQRFLVGSSPSGIQLVSEVADPDARPGDESFGTVQARVAQTEPKPPSGIPE